MKREEALEIFEHNWTCLKNYAYTDNELDEALDMAIQALEQEPDAIHNEREQAYMKGYEDASKRYRTEPCEDAISRQAIIDSLHSKFVDGFDSDRWWNSMSVLYAINKVPSVSTKKPNRCGDLISREETLTAFADYVGSGMSMNDYDALWDIVAKMPSVKTQEPCEDAISRQAVLEQTYKWCKDEFLRTTLPFDYLRKKILSLPSVSTEKTGRWEREVHDERYM